MRFEFFFSLSVVTVSKAEIIEAMRIRNIPVAMLTLLVASATPFARAWDYEGHRTVNQLALAALPANFPAFVKTPAARERIA